MTNPTTLWTLTAAKGPPECRLFLEQAVNLMARDAHDPGLDITLSGDPQDGTVHAHITGHHTHITKLGQNWLGILHWRHPSTLRHTARKSWSIGVFETPPPPSPPTISWDEVRVEHTTSGGPGGQHQNKTQSAIRVHWKNITFLVRDERSQHQNLRLAKERLERLLWQHWAERHTQWAHDLHKIRSQDLRQPPKHRFEGHPLKRV